MRCPVSDRHSDQTATKPVGLCGGQVIVKVRGVGWSHQSGLNLEDGLSVRMECRGSRSVGCP